MMSSDSGHVWYEPCGRSGWTINGRSEENGSLGQSRDGLDPLSPRLPWLGTRDPDTEHLCLKSSFLLYDLDPPPPCPCPTFVFNDKVISESLISNPTLSSKIRDTTTQDGATHKLKPSPSNFDPFWFRTSGLHSGPSYLFINHLAYWVLCTRA